MATINLGAIKFKWQGAYNAGTAYTVDDVVSYNGSSYICILASTGNLPTNATYWEQMAQGSDLGSISGLAQGDIFYYDGSDFQRLGAGTSGQVLQTNGTGANPSWGTVSSDFVNLGSGTVSTTVSTLSIDGYYTSDYDNYIIIINDLKTTASSGNGLYARFNSGGTVQTASSYAVAAQYAGRTIGGSANMGTFSNDGQSSIQITNDLSSDDANTASIVMQIHDPLDTNTYKNVQFDNTTVYQNGNGILRQMGMGHYRGTTNAMSGITFIVEGANSITACKWKIYGLKN